MPLYRDLIAQSLGEILGVTAIALLQDLLNGQSLRIGHERP